MSDDPQPPNPFPGGFDLSQLFSMLGHKGPVNWDVARQIAMVVARADADADGEFGAALSTPPPPEPPIDPRTVDDIGALVRAALPRVVDLTGQTDAFALPVRVIGRTEWVTDHLEALRPVLEAFATALEEATADDTTPDVVGADTDPFGGLMSVIAPVLLGVQAGSMVGQLARRALGRYDLPLPTGDAPSIVVTVTNVDDFEAAWSLDREDVRFAVVIHEVVHAAIRSIDWVRELLVQLAVQYVSAYRVDPAAIEAAFGELDPTDPASLAGLQADPGALLGAISSPEQRIVGERLQLVMSVLEGYADAVIAQVAEPLIPSYPQIREAAKRHRLDRGEAGALIESLLGIELDRDHYEQGEAFCHGVVERAGLDGLNRLLIDETFLPTPNELAAPGLWLARIDLPNDVELPDDFEVPDDLGELDG